MGAARYTITTWDAELARYTPQDGCATPGTAVDIRGLRAHLRELRARFGYEAHRVRFTDGSRDSDRCVLVERVELNEGTRT